MSRDMRKPDICICKNKAADQLCSNWVSLCPFYQQLYSPIEKNQNYAKIPSNYRKIQQKHKVENFVKKCCSFFFPHNEKFKRK